MSMRVLLLAALASVVSIAQSSAAVVTVNGGGEVTGVSGINVGGVLFDATFTDGTCEALYSGCDDLSDFPFATVADTTTALTQIADAFQSSAFANSPSAVVGCDASTVCGPLMPVDLVMFGGSTVVQLYRISILGVGSVSSPSLAGVLGTDVTPSDFTTYTTFTQVSEVPIPAALPLFMAGLAGLRLVQRKRKQKSVSA